MVYGLLADELNERVHALGGHSADQQGVEARLVADLRPGLPEAGRQQRGEALHAARDEIRDVIVPLNKKYPIKELMEACRTYPGGRCGYYDFLAFERRTQEDPEYISTTG